MIWILFIKKTVNQNYQLAVKTHLSQDKILFG